MCEQEEMTRLQQNIEDLKSEFGDEAEDQKVTNYKSKILFI